MGQRGLPPPQGWDFNLQGARQIVLFIIIQRGGLRGQTVKSEAAEAERT